MLRHNLSSLLWLWHVLVSRIEMEYKNNFFRLFDDSMREQKVSIISSSVNCFQLLQTNLVEAQREKEGSIKFQYRTHSARRHNRSGTRQPSGCIIVRTMFGNSDTEEVAKVNNSSSNEGATGENNVAFSKIAQHQADADENLFLRFLELDPPVTDNQSRQSSQTSKNNGRTPFTITKKLTKSPEHGFGFSIVWTHPPRIEKVDAGLPAEKSGIIPGDYIIFIDKYNIVTMPELDILNLIRSQGNTLILEIFRRPQRQGSVRIAPKIITSAVVNRQISTDEEGSVKRSLLWSSSAMSNTSLDTTKRRLKLPQVGAMSKEVRCEGSART